MENQKINIIDFESNLPNTVSEVICIRCKMRWISIRPTKVLLNNLQCPKCRKKGFVIETGQVMKDNEELKEEIADLQKYIETLSENYENEIAGHKKVIKKMRNCGNCNGIINGIRQEKCKFCMRSKLLAEWELAE